MHVLSLNQQQLSSVLLQILLYLSAAFSVFYFLSTLSMIIYKSEYYLSMSFNFIYLFCFVKHRLYYYGYEFELTISIRLHFIVHLNSSCSVCSADMHDTSNHLSCQEEVYKNQEMKMHVYLVSFMPFDSSRVELPCWPTRSRRVSAVSYGRS